MKSIVEKNWKVFGAGAVVTAIALAGCGSSASSTQSSPDTSKALAEFSKIESVPVIRPIGGPIPRDVKLVVAQCNAPTCVDTFAPIREGAEKLGWSVTFLTYDITAGPSALNSALKQGIAANPDYMTWNSAFPYETQSETVEAAKAAGIGLIPINGTMESTLLNCLSCSTQFISAGETAMKVAQALGRDPKVGLVYQPELASQVDELTGMQKQANAAGGSVEGIAVSAANTAPVNNNQVVGYLRTHPDVEYVVTTVDLFSVGLADALRQAGLNSRVKLIKNLLMAGGNSLEEIQSGKATAGVAVELEMASYRVLDTAARDLRGEKIPADMVDPVGWYQVVTRENVGQIPESFQAKDYKQVFYKAWGVA